MKIIALFTVLSISFYHSSFAQEIKAYKTFSGIRFERDSITLGINQVLEIVKENPQAYAELKRAKSNYNAAGMLGFAGGILLGFPLGTALAGGDPEWVMAAGGAALILGSIPFTRAFRGHTKQALDLYNNKGNTSRIRPEFLFYGSGARLIFRF